MEKQIWTEKNRSDRNAEFTKTMQLEWFSIFYSCKLTDRTREKNSKLLEMSEIQLREKVIERNEIDIWSQKLKNFQNYKQLTLMKDSENFWIQKI